MAWILATTLDKRSANLHTSQIAAILARVPGKPQEGSQILFGSGTSLDVTESPAELMRSIESEEHPENPGVSPREAW